MRSPRNDAAGRRGNAPGLIASLSLLLMLLSFATVGFAEDDADRGQLRVCADPNNMPFSNQVEAGFENKLAELAARSLGKTVTYTWWAQRRGFIRHTLKAGACDVIMGVPKRLDMLDTTRPYYRSSYVFVSRANRRFHISSIKDPRLKHLKIGVHLIGNDGFNTPPAHALGQEGIVDNVVGFTIYGDYRQPDPPARLIEAVVKGDIDLAAAWGPLAGYFAEHSPVPLDVVPITDAEDYAPLLFQYDIAIGVRKGDHELGSKLDRFLARHQQEVTELLTGYGVPLVTVGARNSDRVGVAD